MKIRAWWSKTWAKNLVFFGILSIFFFTDIGKWVQIEFTRFRLDAPEYISSGSVTESLYRYDIRIQDVDGNIQPLAAYKGQPVFINMWASWCVPCIAEFPGLEKLKEQLFELEFVALNIEQAEVFQRFVTSTEVELPYYRVTSPLPSELTPNAIPASYILNAEGQVIYAFTGAADWSNPKVAEQIRKLIQ
ncbi:MAG: TlpA disulfide reductase family protein [Cryomorphaceae bacterium]